MHFGNRDKHLPFAAAYPQEQSWRVDNAEGLHEFSARDSRQEGRLALLAAEQPSRPRAQKFCLRNFFS